jgi:hypothetical protein
MTTVPPSFVPLVMTPEEQVYELAYVPEPAAGQWWLLHAPKDPRRGTLA